MNCLKINEKVKTLHTKKMSVMGEDTIIAPWVGPTSFRNTLSVAILSSNVDIIEKISEKLVEVHAKGNYRWKLIVMRSYNLDEIVMKSNVTGKMAIDFVVLGMDTSGLFCIEWAKKALEQVHPDLRFRRVVLVNASGLPVNSMAVCGGDVIAFQKENRLDLLNANVFRTDEALFLARKLLKYIEVSIGVHTGLPNLNI